MLSHLRQISRGIASVSASELPVLQQGVRSLIRSFSTDSAADAAPPSERVTKVADEICSMTLLEVSDLHKLLRKRLGIEGMPSMPMGMPMMAAPAAAPAAAADAKPAAAAPAKEDFDLKLEGFDAAKKIGVIKEVRAITSLGLKEAKELVEAGGVLKKGLKKAEAEDLVKKLEAAGAKVKME